jgi:hypothetical protein
MTILLGNKKISFQDYCYYNYDGLYIAKELMEEITDAFIFETIDNTMINTILHFFGRMIDGIEKEYGEKLIIHVTVLKPDMRITVTGKNIHVMALDNIKALNLKNILGVKNEIFLPSSF